MKTYREFVSETIRRDDPDKKKTPSLPQKSLDVALAGVRLIGQGQPQNTGEIKRV